jgi:fumarylacetoacetate (FAA) hydrolase
VRLATVRDGTRDGRLVVVRKDGEAVLDASQIARTLQEALDGWDERAPSLRALAASLDAGDVDGEPLDPRALHSPLPRAYEWIDGSTYLNHIRLVRRSRNAQPPATLETDPLVYQGGSGVLLAPTEDIPLPDPAWGLDFEGEVCVILGDVRQGTLASSAGRCVRLLCLANDLTYRNLVPVELEKGFGFFQSKPATAFSPFAVTPDELGPAWRDGRVHLRLAIRWNGKLVGDLAAAPAMHFSFLDLVQHLAKTRGFTAGTILGSGTVSNAGEGRGFGCIVEQRAQELIDLGEPRTRFMLAGDTIEIEMHDAAGRNLFGTISQQVVTP